MNPLNKIHGAATGFEANDIPPSPLLCGGYKKPLQPIEPTFAKEIGVHILELPTPN